jgi:hypothetical protein
MKYCPVCKKEKDLSEFGNHKNHQDGKQTYCKSCARNYAQNDYFKKKKYYFDKAEKSKDHFKYWGRDYIWKYLCSHPCLDCGEADPLILEFDHVRGEKDKAVMEMLARHVSKEKLIAEIEKCELRCCNCHRRKSAFQLGWWRDKWEEVGIFDKPTNIE